MKETPSSPSSSTNDNSEFRYEADLEAIMQRGGTKKKWYQRIDLKNNILSAKTAYTFLSISSFICLGLFGVIGMNVSKNTCLIQNAVGPCCSCEPAVEAKLKTEVFPQVMPTTVTYNNIFYGLMLLFNSSFGIVYVIIAMWTENKYLLFCIVCTQIGECFRCFIDLKMTQRLDESFNLSKVQHPFLYIGVVFTVASWLFIYRVFKVFSWKIFRRGGAKRSIRELYKKFQRFRAINLLDTQSSALIFLLFIMYLDVVRRDGAWVYIMFILCDIISSRYLIKYLKREDSVGVIISIIARLFVLLWWLSVLGVYFTCYILYNESLEKTGHWWTMERLPDLESVIGTYRGLSCLAHGTSYDSRTLHLIIISSLMAVGFRIVSLVFAALRVKRFNRGLRDVFYAKKRNLESNEVAINNNDDVDRVAVYEQQFLPPPSSSSS